MPTLFTLDYPTGLLNLQEQQIYEEYFDIYVVF